MHLETVESLQACQKLSNLGQLECAESNEVLRLAGDVAL